VTYSGGDGLTGRVGETTPGYDSQVVLEERRGVDSSLTQAPALCQNIKRSGRGSSCGSCEPARASSDAESSEAESHPRGRSALERGGILPEGPSSPRARRSVTSLVLTLIQNVEFQKLELKWSARNPDKGVFLLPSPKFLDLILAPTILLGFIPC
jgi:hypothetical protein